MFDDAFVSNVIADHSVLIPVGGKLRGRRARQLGDKLTDLAADGITRAVLDMRELTSLDSLGTFALEEGLDAGLRLHLVVRPAFEFDGFFSARPLVGRGLRVHHSLDAALEHVQKLMGSGLALV